MNTLEKIKFYLHRHENRAVFSCTMNEWLGLIRSDGKLTELEDLPSPLSNPVLTASTIVSCASGACVSTPGLDILRHDPKDDPYVINLDHYTIFENFHNHERFNEFSTISTLGSNQELIDIFSENIFIVKEPHGSNHWLRDFPENILNAKKRNA